MRIPFFGRPPRAGHGVLHAVANVVMRRPVLAIAPALLVLAVLASPLSQLSLGQTGIQGLPPQAQARVGLDKLQNDFPNQSVNGAVFTSDSTLTFRGRDDIVDSLLRTGMTVEDVRDAPDRPGREFVFIARR